MLTLGVETIVILILIVGAVSAFGGYVVAQERQRRAGGGKSAAELRTELSEYKENVNTHFQTTAGLLHDMTEQYRAVYEHMASGAQSLCDPDTARTQIESLRAGLLPAGVPDATPVPGAEPEPEPEPESEETVATSAQSDDGAAAPDPTDELAANPDGSEETEQSAAAPIPASAGSEAEGDTVATDDTGPENLPQGGEDEDAPGLEADTSADTNSGDKTVKA